MATQNYLTTYTIQRGVEGFQWSDHICGIADNDAARSALLVCRRSDWRNSYRLITPRTVQTLAEQWGHQSWR